VKRLEAWGLTALFVAMIGIPVIFFAAGARPEPNQNRPPTPLPEITAAGILDRELTPQLDAYLEDALIIAPGAVAAEALTDVALGDSPNPDVTLGENGWLYYTFALTRPCLSADDVATVGDALSRAEHVVAATGRDLVVAIAPDKATIIPDFLPDELDTCIAENAAALSALDAPDALVTVWDEMQAARANDRPIYFRLDTHWTNEGAGVMAAAVVEKLVPGGWNPDAVRETAEVDHEGDLTVLLGLPATEPVDELETALPNTTLNRETRSLLTARGVEYEDAVAVDFSVASEPVIPGDALVMHDSYGWALTPMLAPYFETASFVNEGDPAAGHIKDDLESAELIVFEIVQRSVHETFLERDLAAGFVAAFADEFVAVDQGTRETGERLELEATGPERYVVVELAPGTESAEVAYNDVTAKLNPDSPRAAYYVGPGGTMYFAGVVDFRIVAVGE
jgi:hypothetical protein